MSKILQLNVIQNKIGLGLVLPVTKDIVFANPLCQTPGLYVRGEIKF